MKEMINKDCYINLCFLSHSSGNSGAEKAFPKLLEGIKQYCSETTVFLPNKGPLIRELEKRNINFKIIPYSRWLTNEFGFFKRIKRILKNIFMIIPVMNALKKQKCNIVYTNTSTIPVGAFAAKILGLPHIWHFREFGLEDYNYKFDLGAKISFWLINNFSTVCLANSIAVAEKYRKYLPANKVEVIYESYTPKVSSDVKMTKSNNNYFKCAIVGTLHKTKGQDDAIHAVTELFREGKKIKLFIIGEGDKNYSNYLIELTNKLDAVNCVEFIGYVENVQNIMNQFDVLLMCSKNEAFGLVTIEAMQNGIPVIGTNSGGTKELIENMSTGLLYEKGNYKELSQKIKFLMDNPEIRSKMGIKAHKRAEELFSPDKYLEKTMNYIIKAVKCKINSKT